MSAQYPFITEELLVSLSKYLRLANYIGASQLYLKDNFFLEQPLEKEHIKKRILGHWGTVPGINFVYANLNLIAQRHDQEIMFVVGPGHGYPALLSNLFLEQTLAEFYPEYSLNKDGLAKLIKHFSWPGGFPSHANPETPGVILEGGELGYSLSTSFGAAFDNPDLIVTCLVGDGESESGPLAAAWHSNKFLNPKHDGAVLPILHVNKYKISGPTIPGTMSNEELYNLYSGYGYEPIIIEGDFLYEPMLVAMEDAYQKIKQIQTEARENGKIDKPKWPMIVLITKKGWSGPQIVGGEMIEDSFRSHGIPLEDVHNNQEEFEALESWLRSYKLEELLTDEHKPISQILDLVPRKDLRIGMVKHANGGAISTPLDLPDISQYSVDVSSESRATLTASSTAKLGEFMRDIISKNPKNFRIMSPDETESNKLHALFEVTERCYMWPTPEGSENIGPDGRVMEILSEHTLQGWMEGYTLTGRHSIFITYEAFAMIIASMIDQYTKFLKQSEAIEWRKPVPSLNFVLTSTSWRQDHNGYSHQNPGFISSMLNDYSSFINIHFPSDANMMLATMEEVFATTNKVNIIVAGKRPLPQYLSLEEARRDIQKGIANWEWAGNTPDNPDVVFAATGDYATQESLAAINLLKEMIPDLKTRFISVSELTCFGIGDQCNVCKITSGEFEELFTSDKDIIYSYHGYPEDIKSLVFNHNAASRFKVHGYIEKGTTTTPFDMQVQNRASRYQLMIEAIESASKTNPLVKAKRMSYENQIHSILTKHQEHIRRSGEDIKEVTEFKFKF